MRKLDVKRLSKIIVHHSASVHKKGEDIVETITRWHKERGFETIGYHFLVDQEGNIFNGRSPEYQGAHTKGNNGNSLGVCLIGNGTYTNDQFVALGRIIEKVEILLGKKLKIHPHKYYAETECPGFELNWDPKRGKKKR